jgi:hypothetical protein
VSHAAARLDLDDDELVVHGVHLVRDALVPLLTEQHGATNLLVALLPGLDLEPRA